MAESSQNDPLASIGQALLSDLAVRISALRVRDPRDDKPTVKQIDDRLVLARSELKAARNRLGELLLAHERSVKRWEGELESLQRERAAVVKLERESTAARKKRKQTTR